MSEEQAEAPEADESIDAPVTIEGEEPETVEAEETDELDDLLKQATGTDEVNPDELVEVEVDGKKVKVSADAKDYLLRHADYTQKTMTLAEERKVVAAEKAKVAELQSASQEKLSAIVSAQSLASRLQQLHATPIDGLNQEQVNSLRLEYHETERGLERAASTIQQIDAKERETRQQDTAKAIEAAQAEAANHIPNFSDARLTELGSLVEALGGDPEQVRQLADPIAIRVLHLADIGSKFIERQRQAARAKAAQTTEPAIETGSGKQAPVTRDLNRDADKLSTEEWTKQRNAQVAKRAR